MLHNLCKPYVPLAATFMEYYIQAAAENLRSNSCLDAVDLALTEYIHTMSTDTFH
jgi:hypothetical protein